MAEWLARPSRPDHDRLSQRSFQFINHIVILLLYAVSLSCYYDANKQTSNEQIGRRELLTIRITNEDARCTPLLVGSGYETIHYCCFNCRPLVNPH